MRLVLIALTGCAIGPQPFPCLADAECVDGRCEADGFCSFADPACAGTGRRFGEHAPAALSNQCVAACVDRLQVGGFVSCAVLTDGTARCWGGNGNSELLLGAADNEPHFDPIALPLSPSISELAMSPDHVCAITNGELLCWGTNMFEEIASPASTPIHVPRALGTATRVSSGGNYTCAISNELRCWGHNHLGQLGAGSTLPTSGPLPVVTATGPLAGVEHVDASGSFACAASRDTAWCWGDNTDGKLGDGTTQSRNLAARVQLPAGTINDLRTGASSACAIVDNDVLCWGANDIGQLQRPVKPFDPMPTLITGNPRLPVKLALGAEHACVLDDGQVLCWGSNASGKLGPAANGMFSAMAVRPLGMTTVVDVAAGAQHTCALTTDNRVLCWGGAALGQLGGTKQVPSDIVERRLACGSAQ